MRGKPGKVALEVLEVQRVTPAPIDDELAVSLETENLQDLREKLTARIGSEKERIGKQKQEEQCLDHLLEKHKLEVPPSLVEEQKQNGLAGMEQRLREAGTPDEHIQQQLEASQGEALQDAERRVRMFFLIEAVAKKEGLEVTGADTNAELGVIAEANGVTPAQVRDHLEENNRLGELRLALLERKVRNFLRENAKPVDKKGS